MSKKSSFVLYNDILEEILDLSDRDAGKLFKAIYYFAAEGKESKDDVPPKARTLYSIILKHLKKDEEKYKKRAERSRENGKNGGRPKMDTCGEENQNKPKETYWVFSEPRKPDNVNVNDNVNDNDNVNVNVNDNDNERQTQFAPDANFPHPHGSQKNVFLSSCEYNELKSLYPDLIDSKIEWLSTYMITNGKSYNNHYLLLKRWCEEDKGSIVKKREAPSFNKPSYDLAQFERELFGYSAKK